MKSTFSIIFYLKRQVVKKDGTVPVMGRITVDGTQAQFSCKTTANPDLWDTKGGRMIGKSMQALEVNRKLDKMRVSISKHYQEIMDRDNSVSLLASVYIEDCLECTSHNSLLFVLCKIKS